MGFAGVTILCISLAWKMSIQAGACFLSLTNSRFGSTSHIFQQYSTELIPGDPLDSLHPSIGLQDKTAQWKWRLLQIQVCACRFRCVLAMDGSQSVMRVVETNDFKQLSHISLLFRPGSDTAIKEVFPSTYSVPFSLLLPLL